MIAADGLAIFSQSRLTIKPQTGLRCFAAQLSVYKRNLTEHN